MVHGKRGIKMDNLQKKKIILMVSCMVHIKSGMKTDNSSSTAYIKLKN